MDFEELNRYANNPNRVINTIFNDLETSVLNNGGQLNGKGHPFSYAVDLIVATNYGFISRLGDSTAATYPAHARTIRDLAKVMSDEDWVGVFAEPSGATFRWVVPEDVLAKAAIPYSDVSETMVNNYKKVVLPADTQFYNADIPFLLENPVEIRIMEHGGIQVLYDSTSGSPLKPLVTNYPDKESFIIDGVKYLVIHLPVRQLEVTEFPARPVNITSGFKETFDFKDSLYAVRAFITPDGSETRSEMAIAYNNDVYDPSQPTLTVDVIDGVSFEASIPSVYLQRGTGTGRVTILTYTTKGEMYRDLTTLRDQTKQVSYRDYRNEKGKLGRYSEPLIELKGVYVDTDTPIQGGRNAVEFQELKNMIIYGNRRRRIPVSNSDLDQTLRNAGYTSAKAIDSFSRRLYRTTKDLPVQQNKLFDEETSGRAVTSIGTYTGSILTSIEELVNSGNAIDNGKRITIRRGATFDITGQTSRLIAKHEADAIMGSSNQAKIDLMGKNSLVYLPFTYVLDVTNDRADVRCYRIVNPEIRYQTFRYENSSLGIQVGVGKINIKPTDNGYVIEIETKSSEEYKKLSDDSLGIQISFKTTGSNEPASKRGTLLGKTKEGERIFRFELESRFDIDVEDDIDLRGFNQFGHVQNEVRVGMDEVASFIFTYSGDGVVLRSSADFAVDQSLFERLNIAIIQTDYRVTFGKILDSIYTRITPMVGAEQYEKYPSNVPAIYDADEFETNDRGELVIVGGKAVLKHKKGEPILNTDGTPRWEFLAGQTVKDQDGNPVVKKARELLYYWDFIGFDFNYMLSQDDYDTQYAVSVENFFASQVNDEIQGIRKKLLDETVLLFKPRSTMGYTQVVLNEGVKRTIRTDISLSVVYYLTDEGMVDNDLKEALVANTHEQANVKLAKNTFSVSDLSQELRNANVLDVKILAFAGDEEVDVITNIDDTNGFSVSKSLDQTSDKLLTIKEGIEISFRRHVPRT